MSVADAKLTSFCAAYASAGAQLGPILPLRQAEARYRFSPAVQIELCGATSSGGAAGAVSSTSSSSTSSSSISSSSGGSGDERVSKIRAKVCNWRLSTATLRAISRIPAPALQDLSELVIVNVALTADDFAVLASDVMPACSGLTHLEIGNTQLPGANWAKLLEFPLTHLVLRGNAINDAQAAAIATSLASSRTLYALNLSRNNIGRPGADAIAEALRTNGVPLAFLSLSHNQLTDEALFSLAKALRMQPLSADDVAARRKAIMELEKFRIAEEPPAPTESSQKKKTGRDEPVKGAAGKKGAAGQGTQSSTVQAPQPASQQQGGQQQGQAQGQSLATAAGNAASMPQTKAKGGPAAANAAKDTPLAAKNAPPKKGKAPVVAAAQEATSAPPPAQRKGTAGKRPTVSINLGDQELDDSLGSLNGTNAQTVSLEIYEINGSWFTPGNRTLNYLNIGKNCISALGMKHMYEAISDQIVEELKPGTYSVYGKDASCACIGGQFFPHLASASGGLATVNATAPGSQNTAAQGNTSCTASALNQKCGLLRLVHEHNLFSDEDPNVIALEGILASRQKKMWIAAGGTSDIRESDFSVPLQNRTAAAMKAVS